MKAKEYGAYPTRNVQSGGQMPSYDEFNREYKKVRYTSAQEYACRNVKEYNRYPEYKDMTGDDDNCDQQISVTGAALQYGASFRTANAVLKRRRIAQQLICIVAGSTIIVSAYQAMMNQPQPEPAPLPAIADTDDRTDDTDIDDIVPDEENTVPAEETTVPAEETTVQTGKTTTAASTAAVNYTPKWVWSSDKKTVTLELYDSNGKLVHEIPAKVSVTTKDATCTKEGLKTYTATAEYDGKTYSDTTTETLDALGHSFDKGKEVTQSDGKTAMVFECKRCHEKFKIANDMSEND
ncbi:MAG: hypothetical protein IJS03_02790 [Eubacterium sp.]|nr:hypothetical protein [Eubacterium sp.]